MTGMKLQLLASKWCSTCPTVAKVWSEAKAGRDHARDVTNADGRRTAADFGIRIVPAVAIDSRLRAVGTCTAGDV